MLSNRQLVVFPFHEENKGGILDRASTNAVKVKDVREVMNDDVVCGLSVSIYWQSEGFGIFPLATETKKVVEG